MGLFDGAPVCAKCHKHNRKDDSKWQLQPTYVGLYVRHNVSCFRENSLSS